MNIPHAFRFPSGYKLLAGLPEKPGVVKQLMAVRCALASNSPLLIENILLLKLFWISFSSVSVISTNGTVFALIFSMNPMTEISPTGNWPASDMNFNFGYGTETPQMHLSSTTKRAASKVTL